MFCRVTRQESHTPTYKPLPGKAQEVTPMGSTSICLWAKLWWFALLFLGWRFHFPHRIPGLLWLPAQIITHPLGWRTQGGTNKKPETSQARQLTPVIPALSLHYGTRPYPKMKIRNWISFVEAKLGGAGAQGEPERKWGGGTRNSLAPQG